MVLRMLCKKYSLFRTALAWELERRANAVKGCAVVMMDLDDFKRTNDTHGHLAGSFVLQEVGRIINFNSMVLAGEEGFTTMERVSVRPTLEIHGLPGGFTGPGKKTVIPAAKIMSARPLTI